MEQQRSDTEMVGTMKVDAIRKRRKDLVAEGMKPFACEHVGCKKRFLNMQAKNEHLRWHTGNTPYECPEDGCGRKFKWRSSLSSHKKTHQSSGGQVDRAARGNGASQGDQGEKNTVLVGPGGVVEKWNAKDSADGQRGGAYGLSNADSEPQKTSTPTGKSTSSGGGHYGCPVDGCGRSFKWRSSLASHKRARQHASVTGLVTTPANGGSRLVASEVAVASAERSDKSEAATASGAQQLPKVDVLITHPNADETEQPTENVVTSDQKPAQQEPQRNWTVPASEDLAAVEENETNQADKKREESRPGYTEALR